MVGQQPVDLGQRGQGSVHLPIAGSEFARGHAFSPLSCPVNGVGRGLRAIKPAEPMWALTCDERHQGFAAVPSNGAKLIDSPQPQLSVTLGLRNLKPDSSRPDS